MTRTVIFRRESLPGRLAVAGQRKRVLRWLEQAKRPTTATELGYLTGMGTTRVAELLAGMLADGLVTATEGTVRHHNRDHAATFYRAG